MSIKHLIRKPTHITKELWYYEEEMGFRIYHVPEKWTSHYIGTITWEMMQEAIQRLERKDENKD